MKKIFLLLIALNAVFCFAQNSELRSGVGAATNTAYSNPKLTPAISPCISIQYIENTGRFQYGVAINAYKMLLKSNDVITVANPAVPVAFLLNYKIISTKNFYAYAGVNLGAGKVFVDNTVFNSTSGNSPYIGFFGANFGVSQSISKHLALNADVSGRESEINYRKNNKYGFLQAIGCLHIVYEL